MTIDWSPVIEEARQRVDDGHYYIRKWQTIRAVVGRRRITYRERVDLAASIKEAGLSIAPAIDGQTPAGKLYMTIGAVSDASKPTFRTEREFQKVVADNLHLVEDLEGVKRVGTEVVVQGGRMDLLASKNVDGVTRWYVIEMKLTDIDGAANQAIRYAQAFKATGGWSSTIGRGPSVNRIRPKEGDQFTVVVIAHETSVIHAKSMHAGAKAAGFYAKWIPYSLGKKRD